MYDEFETFLEDPSAENYRRARRAVLSDPSWPPDSLELLALSGSFEAGRHRDVLGSVQGMMPRWALCSRVHYLAARAADGLGEREEFEVERFLMASCIEGVRATGSGGPERPYLITHTTDEFDLLWSLRLRPCRQRLVSRGESILDVIACEDGSEVWFEATEAVRAGPQLGRTAAAHHLD